VFLLISLATVESWTLSSSSVFDSEATNHLFAYLFTRSVSVWAYMETVLPKQTYTCSDSHLFDNLHFTGQNSHDNFCCKPNFVEHLGVVCQGFIIVGEASRLQ